MSARVVAPIVALPELPGVRAVVEGRERWAVVEGDALDLLPRLPPASFDLLVADMPYSSGGVSKAERSKSLTRGKYSKDKASLDILGDSRDQRQWIVWCGEWLRRAAAALRPGALVATFCDWRMIGSLEVAFGLTPIQHRGTAPWIKRTGRPQKGRPRQDCEFILWGTLGKRALEGAVLPGHYTVTLPHKERTLFCKKPDALMEQIAHWAPENGLILDPFAGTGSTAIGALRTGRRVVTFDLDPVNVGVTIERLRAQERGEVVARTRQRRRAA